MITEEGIDWKVERAGSYLESIRRLGEDVAAQQALADAQRELADGVRGIDYSALRVSTSPSGSQVEDALERIQSAVAEYCTLAAEYTDMRMEANRALCLMGDFTEARALRCRYLLGWDWERICVEMRYTYDGMMKLRRRALCSFYDVMPGRAPSSRATAEAPYAG